MTTFARSVDALERMETRVINGTVDSVRGLTVYVRRLRVPIGSVVRIDGGSRQRESLLGEVIGFDRSRAIVMLLGGSSGTASSACDAPARGTHAALASSHPSTPFQPLPLPSRYNASTGVYHTAWVRRGNINFCGQFARHARLTHNQLRCARRQLCRAGRRRRSMAKVHTRQRVASAKDVARTKVLELAPGDLVVEWRKGAQFIRGAQFLRAA